MTKSSTPSPRRRARRRRPPPPPRGRRRRRRRRVTRSLGSPSRSGAPGPVGPRPRAMAGLRAKAGSGGAVGSALYAAWPDARPRERAPPALRPHLPRHARQGPPLHQTLLRAALAPAPCSRVLSHQEIAPRRSQTSTTCPRPRSRSHIIHILIVPPRVPYSVCPLGFAQKIDPARDAFRANGRLRPGGRATTESTAPPSRRAV